MLACGQSQPKLAVLLILGSLDIGEGCLFEPRDRHFTDTISKLRKRLLRVAKNCSKCKQAKK